MKSETPKTKSLINLKRDGEIILPNIFHGGGFDGHAPYDNLRINEAFLLKAEAKEHEAEKFLQLYANRNGEKELKYTGYIRISSRAIDSGVIKEIGKVLNLHLRENVEDIFSAKLFS